VRVEVWVKHTDSGQLHQCFLVDKVERDIELPAGIFDTTPPTDYTLGQTQRKRHH